MPRHALLSLPLAAACAAEPAPWAVPRGDPPCTAVAFSPTPYTVDLPEAGLWDNDRNTTGSSGNFYDIGADSQHNHEVTDITGDGRADIVVKADTVASDWIGRDYWNVHVNSGHGLARTPMPFRLPEDPRLSYGRPWTYFVEWSQKKGDFEHCTNSFDIFDVEWRWVLRDLTGDGRPDLVVTMNECVDATVGIDHWNVYVNTGERFTYLPRRFDLPESSSTNDWPWGELDGGQYRDDCRSGATPDSTARMWSVYDITGDRLPDLVMSEDTCADRGIGRDHWRVYANTGHGFGPEPFTFSLPPRSTDEDTPWSRWGEKDYSDGQCLGLIDRRWIQTQWATTDLTGDGLPDVVVTWDPCTDPDIGVTHWNVHVNDGAGVAAEPMPFPLPEVPGHEEAPWQQTEARYEGAACADGRIEEWDYRLLDLTGDGRPDLVVTVDECSDPLVGERYWWVYANTGAGFEATPAPFPLPFVPLSGSPPWSDTYQPDRVCLGAYADEYPSLRWSLHDLTGDGLLDLLVTDSSCADPRIGEDYWHVYPAVCAG